MGKRGRRRNQLTQATISDDAPDQTLLPDYYYHDSDLVRSALEPVRKKPKLSKATQSPNDATAKLSEMATQPVEVSALLLLSILHFCGHPSIHGP